MSPEKHPAYKFEEFGDTEIKTEEELNEAKIEAGVRKHEEVLKDALREALKTNDKVLQENVLEEFKRIGALEYYLDYKKRLESGELKDVSENKEGLKQVKDSEIEKKAKELVEEESEIKNPDWALKRVVYLVTAYQYSPEDAFERAKREDIIGRVAPSFVETNGIVDKIIKDQRDILYFLGK